MSCSKTFYLANPTHSTDLHNFLLSSMLTPTHHPRHFASPVAAWQGRRPKYHHHFRHHFNPRCDVFTHFASMKNNHITFKVTQDDKGYDLWVDVPGVKVDDMSLIVEENGKSLTLTGVRKIQQQPQRSGANGGTSVEESKFTRRFAIGDDVNVEEISAHLEDGVLNVRLPKKELEVPKKRQIRIVSTTSEVVPDGTSSVTSPPPPPSSLMAPPSQVSQVDEDDENIIVTNGGGAAVTRDDNKEGKDDGKVNEVEKEDDKDEAGVDVFVGDETLVSSSADDVAVVMLDDDENMKEENVNVTDNTDIEKKEEEDEFEIVFEEKVEAETCDSDDEA